MKDKTIFWIVGIIIVAMLLYNNPDFFSVFNPSQNTAVSKITYNYYFPVTQDQKFFPKCSDKTKSEEVYYCNNDRIYRNKCGSKTSIMVERCPLGCTTETGQVDIGSATYVTCRGSYKPSQRLCSSDGSILYSTDKLGNINFQRCCSCKSGRCYTGKCSYINPSCTLMSGNGNPNNINVVLYNDDLIPDYWKWVQMEFQKTTPYNQFNFNFYREYPEGQCNSVIKYKNNDVKINFGDARGHTGWGNPSSGNGPGVLTIKYTLVNKEWEFLLLHELGHIYTHHEHTCDGSIMDKWGGNGKYNQMQISLIKRNLNSSIATYSSPYTQCDYQ